MGRESRSIVHDDSLTRAQYAALLAKAFELVPRREATVFNDVAADFWAHGAIARANLVGFLAGYPDSTFRQAQNLTIAETIKSLVNGLQFARGNPNSLSVYVDQVQIPNFATDEIATATEGKIVVNYPAREKLSPARDITRGEISALIYQTLVATNRAEPILSLHRLRELGDKGEGNLGYQKPTHFSSPLCPIPSLWPTLTHTRPLPLSQVLICEYPNRFMIEH